MADPSDTTPSPFILGVCGPTGSGKSTLTAIIATAQNVGVVHEPIPQELLDAFAEAPVQFGLALQSEIISARLRARRELRSVATIVLDRTIQEDREVFFNLHYYLGYLTPAELTDLRNQSEEIEVAIGRPHAVVFLTATPKILTDRMSKDNRPTWLIKTLELQLELYEKFEKHLGTPCLKIDTTELESTDLAEVASWIQTTMLEAFNGCYASHERLKIAWRP